MLTEGVSEREMLDLLVKHKGRAIASEHEESV